MSSKRTSFWPAFLFVLLLGGCGLDSAKNANRRCGTFALGPLKPQKICYQVQGKYAVAFGDIILGKVEDIENPQKKKRSAVAIAPEHYRWPQALIPYRIDDPQRHFSKGDHDELLWGTREFVSYNSAFFAPIEDSTQLRIIRLEGRSGGRATVGRRSWSTMEIEPSTSFGIWIHEMGHVLGLFHEHQRTDRNQFIVIHEDNLPEDDKYAYLDLLEGSRSLNLGPYDYRSVMHYENIRGEPPIFSRKDGIPQEFFGGSRLTAEDNKRIRQIYRKPTKAHKVQVGLHSGVPYLVYTGYKNFLFHKTYLNIPGTPAEPWSGRLPFGIPGERSLDFDIGSGDLFSQVFFIGLDSSINVMDRALHSKKRSLGGKGKEIKSIRNSKDLREVFYVGTDNKIYHNEETEVDQWAGEKLLSNGNYSNLQVGKNSDGRLEVFAIDNHSGKVVHAYENAQGHWTSMLSLHFNFRGRKIRVKPNRDGNLEVFALANTLHGSEITHMWQRGSGGWEGPYPLVSGHFKEMEVGVFQGGRLELFITNSEHQIYHMWHEPDLSWSPLTHLGGRAKAIGVGSFSDGRTILAYQGIDGNLWWRGQTAPHIWGKEYVVNIPRPDVPGVPTPVCGNGLVEEGEECDDGRNYFPDGCNDRCEVCGNGIIDNGEICDDGNRINGDGCSSVCYRELEIPSICGDGIHDPSNDEECDDGNKNEDDWCSNDCKIQFCGNGRVEHKEECDDGNRVNNDGCSAKCEIEAPSPPTPPDPDPPLPPTPPDSDPPRPPTPPDSDPPLPPTPPDSDPPLPPTPPDSDPPLPPTPPDSDPPLPPTPPDSDPPLPPTPPDSDPPLPPIPPNPGPPLPPIPPNPGPPLPPIPTDPPLPPTPPGPTEPPIDSECGNGVVEPGESCDDGNTDDGDGCSSLCLIETLPPDSEPDSEESEPETESESESETSTP